MAAQALGASPWHIIWRHLIPNSISPIIVGFVLAIPLAMMLEASLSFLGIGVPAADAELGPDDQCRHELHVLLLAHGGVPDRGPCHHHSRHHRCFGDGLRDALDPTLKGR